jgi:hypothetical protein
MAVWFGQKKAVPSIDSLKFETTGWMFHGEREPGKVRLWETADRDAVSLHFFAKPPDLPVVKTVAESAAKADRHDVSGCSHCSVSRLRRVLRAIEGTAQIDKAIAQLPRFPLPRAAR